MACAVDTSASADARRAARERFAAVLVARLHLGLRDYVRHPVLLAQIVVLGLLGRSGSRTRRRAAADVISELKVEVGHRRGVASFSRLLGARGGTRLNIGCGARLRTGWTNVDIVPPAEIRLDIRKPLPAPDSYCSEIYSEHVFEHLRFPGEADAVLRDWHRVLRPGGTVCVGIPDTRPVLRAYVERDEEYFRELASAPDSAAWAETPLDHVNFHFRQQGLAFGQDHWYAYDFETISARLRDAGFVDIRSRDFDPAQDSRPGTLFVVARKP